MNALPGPPAHEVPVAEARAGHIAEAEQLSRRGRAGGRGPRRHRSLARRRGSRAAARARERARRRRLHPRRRLDDGLDRHVRRAAAPARQRVGCDVSRRRVPAVARARVPGGAQRLRWRRSRRLAAEGGPFAVAGDSAGGNLAAVCARRLRGEVDLRLQALIYPVTDAGLNRPSYQRVRERFGLSAAQVQSLLGVLPRRRRRRGAGRFAAARRRSRRAWRLRSSSPPRPTSCATRARRTWTRSRGGRRVEHVRWPGDDPRVLPLGRGGIGRA